MKRDIKCYLGALKALFDKISAVGRGDICRLDEAIDMSLTMIAKILTSGGKIILIGNGGSASIASHIATDFCKNAGMRALAFNDATLLTCFSNDYGYKHVFEKPIENFTAENDILIAISSSGQSENILFAVRAAKKRGAKIITLSGFDKYNKLKKLGDINFYVPSSSYGHVEITHLAILHSLVDIIIEKKKEVKDFTKN